MSALDVASRSRIGSNGRRLPRLLGAEMSEDADTFQQRQDDQRKSAEAEYAQIRREIEERRQAERQERDRREQEYNDRCRALDLEMRERLDKARGLPDAQQRESELRREYEQRRDLIDMELGAVDFQVTMASVRGENNMVPSSYLLQGADACRIVGRLDIPDGYGSGFLVGPGVLMTNNHVLPTEKSADDSAVWFDFIGDHEDLGLEYKNYKFEPKRLFVTNEDLDYTIVAIAEDQGLAARGWCPIARPTADEVSKLERVNIIQHPAGIEQQVALRDNQVTLVGEKSLFYESDTQGSSSGSPVWSDAWRLVGLHSVGFADGIGNRGIRIGQIEAHLRTRLKAGELSKPDAAAKRDLINACLRPLVRRKTLVRQMPIAFGGSLETGRTTPKPPKSTPPKRKRPTPTKEADYVTRTFDDLSRFK